MAVSPSLASDAANVKQYSGDVACTSGLVWLFLIHRDRSALRRCIATGLAGAALLFFSQIIIIVSAGLLASEFLLLDARERTRGFRSRGSDVAAGAVPLVLSFVLLYFFCIRVQHTPYLRDFWAHRFVPWSRGIGPVCIWLETAWREAFGDLGANGGWLLAIVAAVGAPWAIRVNRFLWRAAAAIVLMAFLAAALRQFPFGDRVSKYLAVPLDFLAVLGCQGICTKLKDALAAWSNRRLAAVVASLPMIAPAIVAIIVLIRGTTAALHPQARSASRAVISYLRQQAIPSDRVLVSKYAMPVIRWYWPVAILDPRVQVFSGQKPLEPGVNYWIFPKAYEKADPFLPDAAFDYRSQPIDQQRSMYTEFESAIYIDGANH